MKTFAVVVTYNRKSALAENIRMLLKQTFRFDKIIIVDNHSTDGTKEFLHEKGWDDGDFLYVELPTNIGGAGGFHVGTKTAYEQGADWILLMDDDGRPADVNAVQILMNRATELYRDNIGDRKLFVNCLVQEDDWLSFKLGKAYRVEEAEKAQKDGLVVNEANPFNGTAISRELVDAIGLPNQDFFIKGDEVDYKRRAFKSGSFVCTVFDARYFHPRLKVVEKTVLGVKVPFFVEAPWKEYYTARNFTFMYKKEKRYKAILFEIIFVKTLAIFTYKCNKYQMFKMLIKGVFDGWNGNLGATIIP